jgi:hypothetical protein
LIKDFQCCHHVRLSAFCPIGFLYFGRKYMGACGAGTMGAIYKKPLA